jgi:RecA-family ATPase
VADAVPMEPRPDPEPTAADARLGGVVMRRASDIEPLDVDWLWKDRVPLGMLTLFAGDPKCGKSFVTIHLAAAVSRGASLLFGDPPDGPASVVILNAEDDPARTIVPRLKAAGADLSRIHIIEAVQLDDGTEALPSLRSDIEKIEEAVSSMGDCRLIIIDPISAYLGGTDDHRNGELRAVLSPLKALAERHGIAVVLVTHLNKGAGTNGKYRVTGSIAYVGACRANFLFVRDREDPTGRRVLMLDNGCNLSDSVPTLAFRIEDQGEGPTVSWEAEPVDVTAEQALTAEPQDQREGDNSEARECDRWLRECLASGPVAVNELIADGRSAGFSKYQLKRAKERIGATSKREGFGRDSRCLWSLARTEADSDEGPEGRPYGADRE